MENQREIMILENCLNENEMEKTLSKTEKNHRAAMISVAVAGGMPLLVP